MHLLCLIALSLNLNLLASSYLFLQVYGQNLQVLMIQGWVKSLQNGKEFAWKELISRNQTVTSNSINNSKKRKSQLLALFLNFTKFMQEAHRSQILWQPTKLNSLTIQWHKHNTIPGISKGWCRPWNTHGINSSWYNGLECKLLRSCTWCS